jgi:hypothetical protein
MVVPADRRALLLRVLELMDSRHQIQTYDERKVVEICNAYLVSTLLDRFGHPPASSGDPDLPWIGSEFVPMFANGHLQATGGRSETYVSLRGHEAVMPWLAEEIRSQTKAGPPTEERLGKRLTIRWQSPPDVAGIGKWLDGVL